jgi:MGT family glycosyltransferase
VPSVAGGMNELHTAYRLVLDALATLPVQALLTTGEALDPASLGTIPDNVVALRFVPQAELLGHVRAVLCHGGSGTVLGTLAAGVPMVVLPLFADQPTNAAEVAKVGAGLSVPYAGATSDALAQALTRVLGESSFSDRARALAAEMAALPHVSEVPAWLSQVKA